MSAVEITDPVEVSILVYEVIVQQYFGVAILTVLVYHSVLHLEEEMTYFWIKPCNTVGVIYFVNKYAGIIGGVCNIMCTTKTIASNRVLQVVRPISEDNCQEKLIRKIGLSAYWINGITTWANIVLIDYILTIRILALYQRDRRMAFFLQSLLATEGVVLLGLFIYGGLVDKAFVGGLVDGMTICLTSFNQPVSLNILSWAFPMVYGLVLLVLSLYRAADYWKMSRSFKAFPLVKVLVEDQVIYYIFVIACCVLRIVVLTNESNFFVMEFINAAGNPSFLSFLGSYLLIHLKKAGEKEMNGGVNNISQSVSTSTMMFA